MSSPLTSSHNGIILDACCVMNLYASGQMAEVIASIIELVAVTVYVKNIEALFIYKQSSPDTLPAKVSVDLQPLIDQGLLQTVDLETDAEKISFINLTASRMDDGEAMTGAIALHRHWAIATDDRQCRTVFRREAPQIQLISTAELVKHWVDTIKPEACVVCQVLKNIEAGANYLVGVKDPLYNWWQTNKL